MLFIFDWDGTLLDSTGKIVSCIQKAIDDVGLPSRTDEEAKSIIGLGLPEAVKALFPDVSDKDLLALSERYGAHFIEADQTPCPFYPGVEDVLEALRGEGHKLAVATGKTRRGLNRVLTNLDMIEYFHASRCADETASKPNPLMLFELLEELKHHADDAVMIGDTEFDLEMANRAGIKSIAVTYGAHGEERLLKCAPQACIGEFHHLLNWSNNLS